MRGGFNWADIGARTVQDVRDQCRRVYRGGDFPPWDDREPMRGSGDVDEWACLANGYRWLSGELMTDQVAMIERLRAVAARATAFLAASDGVATFAAHVELERVLAALQLGDMGE